MNDRPLPCSKCEAPLPPELFNRPDFADCPSCGSPTQVRTFPAWDMKQAPQTAEDIGLADEAGCFFHPGKKAVVACDSCGRYLCKLCDIDFNGGHMCASCLEAGKSKKKIKNLETHRVLYDNIALAVAILPLLIYFFTIVTAPIAFYMSVKYWKKPTSIIPRTKWRLVAAMIISGLQIAGWVFVVAGLWTGF